MDGSTHLYLGKSSNGVYCALIYHNVQHQLQVWFLDESCGRMEWEFKYDIKFSPVIAKFSLVEYKDGLPNKNKYKDRNLRPWIFLRGNCLDEDVKEGLMEDNVETRDIKVNCDPMHFRDTTYIVSSSSNKLLQVSNKTT